MKLIKKDWIKNYMNKREEFKWMLYFQKVKLLKNIKNKLIKKKDININEEIQKSLLKKLLKNILKDILKGCILIIKYIKKVIIEEKYFYIRLLIFLIIIVWTYDVSYIGRYMISIIIVSWIVLYKKLDIVFKDGNFRYKYSVFFATKCKGYINKYLRLPIYLILNRYVWLKQVQRLWILFSKIIRYISLKLKLLKYYRYIDEIMYYIIMVYLRVLIDQSYIITEKIKIKIKKKTYKEIIDWRLLILIINIILIQEILKMLGLSLLGIIIIISLILNIYLLDKMLIYLYWYNRYIPEALYLVKSAGAAKVRNSEIYFLIQRQLEVFSHDSTFFYNLRSEWRTEPHTMSTHHHVKWGVYHNRIISDYICCGFIGSWLNEGRDYFNKYWLNPELYYDDIIGGINIVDINDFFFNLNVILERKSYLEYQLEIIESKGKFESDNLFCVDYRCNLNIKSVKKKVKKKTDSEIDFENIKIRRKITPKNKYKRIHKLYFSWSTITEELNEINKEAYKKCIEFLYNLDLILKENGQVIKINTNVLIIRDTSLKFGSSANDDNSTYYFETIYNNYQIDNSNYKFKLTSYLQKINLKLILDEIKGLDFKRREYIKVKKEDKAIENIDFIDYKYNITNKRPRKVGIYLQDTDSDSDFIYGLLNLEKYKTYYMEERVEILKKMINNKSNIKINEEVNKYKIDEKGELINFISKKEADLQREKLKWLSDNNKSIIAAMLKNKFKK